MSLPQSPFAPSTSVAGAGEIVLSLLPPGKQALQVFKYQYPLKLIAPEPHSSSDDKHVTIAFLLTYGGGLVGGDQVNLKIELQETTRLILLTQGSTKLFKAPNKSVVSKQTLDVKIGHGAALCYLPDPTQPFAESVYEQKQTFYVAPEGTSNLLMLDWVSEGRRALGESWTLWSWKGRNEVREFDRQSKGRLLLRDAVMLHEDGLGGVGLVDKADNMAIFGTLIVYGTLFGKLAEFLMNEFANQPRIGAKNWTQEPLTHTDQAHQAEGLLWTVARVRGFVLVKFGAKDLDGARHWLGDLLKREGTVEQLFGHQALMCLR
ncbi:uncharacterized protein PV06_07330 [Exophiala oligosperma]|uniref:Urease accessory protein UreD n=2 Tax=Chaetothyriales TaxID=34395 RepID=A0A0D2DX90_9EURO|nr:uncharacterized protein PV06_07330 [Exophiala oligosperma]KAJ9639117.1 hypothetical protein H2204_004025 [Knufia peltigerae]KIW40099.1 hypothetical protein PV06_07330 [Exophiala oligosperma]